MPKRVFLSLISIVNALPTHYRPRGLFMTLLARDSVETTSHSLPLTSGEYYVYMATSIALVLLGGVFAGLTLGLMGQDEVYLKVIAASGSANEKKCAKTVLELIGNGKHWLLVTLLLSNVITNETLPVILDRFLGGGFAAVFSATVAIVIFGEIIPQSICVRYGLELGAFFAPYVLALMYLMYPIAYPIAMLLDWILGQDHGTLYKKSGLKTLVNLHHTMGVERLNADEVTIINSVLDLKAKPVKEIMTPIDKAFKLPSDQILDEKMVEDIFNVGYSRIPIHLPGEPYNFVGMLLVRILISYDPEDALPVSSFPLATLPETAKDTSCLNILNYFQEGKSHMVVVSKTPGLDTGAIGVVTLEDVIEELIGEEIVDESDVYIDENKTIMRKIPGPLGKRNVTSYLHELYKNSRRSIDSTNNPTSSTPAAYISKSSFSQKNSRSNSLTVHPKHPIKTTTPIHPKECHINPKIAHGIKPSNLAVDPLSTKNTHITIKKQPQLKSTSPISPKVTDAETDGLLKRNLNGALADVSYGSTPEPEELQSHIPEVHNNEAAAFVQGLMDNASRVDQKVENGDEITVDEELDAVKKRYMISNSPIPLPKPRGGFGGSKSSLSQDNGSSNGGRFGSIFENSFVSSRGVQKTIIETHPNEDNAEESDVATDVSMKSGKKGRAGSFWGLN